MEKMSWHILLLRLSGLVRSRSILSVFTILMMAKCPQAATSMAIALAMAMGVSAVDAFRGVRSPEELITKTTEISQREEEKD